MSRAELIEVDGKEVKANRCIKQVIKICVRAYKEEDQAKDWRTADKTIGGGHNRKLQSGYSY